MLVRIHPPEPMAVSANGRQLGFQPSNEGSIPSIATMKIKSKIGDFIAGIVVSIIDWTSNLPDKCKGCGSRTPPWTLPDGTPCDEKCFFKVH